MSEQLNLKQLERKAYRSTFQDGLWDLYLAGLMACLGILGLIGKFQEETWIWLVRLYGVGRECVCPVHAWKKAHHDAKTWGSEVRPCKEAAQVGTGCHPGYFCAVQCRPGPHDRGCDRRTGLARSF